MKMTTFALLGLLSLAGCGSSLSSTRNTDAPPPVLSEAAPTPGSAPSLPTLERDGGVGEDETPTGPIRVLGPRSASTPGTNLRYDSTTEITLSGDIVGRREVRMDSDSDQRAVIVRLHSGGEVVPVYVGPINWLAGNQVPLEVTRKIVVRGSRVDLNGEMVVMARTIDAGGGEVQLRDANGNPAWAVPATE